MLSTLGGPMLNRPRRTPPPSIVGDGRMRVLIRCKTVLPLTSRDRDETDRPFNGDVTSAMPVPRGGHLGLPLEPPIPPPTLSPSSVTAEPALALPAPPVDSEARDPLAKPRGVDGGVPEDRPAAGGGPMSKGDGLPPRGVRTTAASRRCINLPAHGQRHGGMVARSTKTAEAEQKSNPRGGKGPPSHECLPRRPVLKSDSKQ